MLHSVSGIVYFYNEICNKGLDNAWRDGLIFPNTFWLKDKCNIFQHAAQSKGEQTFVADAAF